MGATVNYNKSHNGIEIRFSEKPNEDGLNWLHANRYRWSMRQRVWYRHYSESDYKKAVEKFGSTETSNTTAPSPASPKLPPDSPKELTQAEILQKGGRELEYLWNIAHLTLGQFVAKKFDRIDIPGHEPYVWDEKKSAYAQLLPKRKRPDYYPYQTMLSVIQSYVLRKKLIIPLTAIFSLKSYHSLTADSLKYLLRDHPQLLNSEDYQQIADQINGEENAYKAEFDKWQAIREKYFKVGQVVFVKDKNTGKAEAWKITNLKISYYPGHICSLIKLQRGSGYIIFMGEQRLSNVYLENPDDNKDAKPFTEILPELEQVNTIPVNQDIEKAKARLRLLKLKLKLK